MSPTSIGGLLPALLGKGMDRERDAALHRILLFALVITNHAIWNISSYDTQCAFIVTDNAFRFILNTVVAALWLMAAFSRTRPRSPEL